MLVTSGQSLMSASEPIPITASTPAAHQPGRPQAPAGSGHPRGPGLGPGPEHAPAVPRRKPAPGLVKHLGRPAGRFARPQILHQPYPGAAGLPRLDDRFQGGLHRSAAGEVPALAGPFPAASGPNHAGIFRCTWLSSDLLRESGWLSCVDGLVAGGADHEGLPAHLGHELCPRGLWPSRPGEVGEFADLVDFYPGTLVAPLAPPGAEPDDQLPAAGGRGGLAVGEDLCVPRIASTALTSRVARPALCP
jgi:hypothetical protein